MFMRNILIIAAIAGLVSAITIYFVSESQKIEDDFITDIE